MPAVLHQRIPKVLHKYQCVHHGTTVGITSHPALAGSVAASAPQRCEQRVKKELLSASFESPSVHQKTLLCSTKSNAMDVSDYAPLGSALIKEVRAAASAAFMGPSKTICAAQRLGL